MRVPPEWKSTPWQRPVTTIEDLPPNFWRLVDALESESDPVKQQQAIELLAVRMATRLSDPEAIRTFSEGFTRHVMQLIEQFLALSERQS